MDQEKYTLTWQTYPDHLRGMMQEMMTSENFADVTLVCDNKKTVGAHRNILSACSPVFKDILLMSTQSNHPVIYLRGIQYSEIESILQFMYLGEAKFYEERMNKFLCAVKDLEIKELCKGVESNEPQRENTLDEATEGSEKVTNESTNDYISDDENHTVDNDKIRENEDETVGSNHAMQQTETGKLFQCKQCDKTFCGASGLHHHNKSKHEGVKYACNQCDSQFTLQSSLTTHIQSIHEGIKYACNQCDYQATSQSHLKTHIKSKHEGVKYACNQCEYQGSKGALRHHLKIKHL